MTDKQVIPEFVKGEFPVSHNRFLRWVGRLGLRVLGGWKINGEMPHVRKAILPVAPHTSNWDFPVGSLRHASYGVKAELFS